VFLNSYYDIKFNINGTTFALIGVVVTSLYQIVSITISSKKKDEIIAKENITYL